MNNKLFYLVSFDFTSVSKFVSQAFPVEVKLQFRVFKGLKIKNSQLLFLQTS